MKNKLKTIRIGMFGSDWNEVYERVFRGILTAAGKDRRVVVCDCRITTDDDDFRSDAGQPPWTNRLDGAVISIGIGDAKSSQQVADWIARGGVPVVNIGADVLDPKITSIFTDPASVAQLAAEHLLACGCRRFLHIGYSRSVGRRAGAFREVLAKHGFALETYDFIVKLEENKETPDISKDVRALTALLKASPEPLGVLAVSDPFARAVWNVCDEIGLQVPKDVAIVGVNDLPMAFAQRPTLTSIRFPGEEIGERATELLLSLIDGGRRPRKPIGVPATHLVARDSTVSNGVEYDDMTAALEVIRRRACTGLSVADLTNMLGVSPRWLELAFQRNLGRSPLAEINRLRLATARKLLETTELPFNHVSTLTGFAFPSGLAAFFQKHTSLSLTEYRKWIRQGGGD